MTTMHVLAVVAGGVAASAAGNAAHAALVYNSVSGTLFADESVGPAPRLDAGRFASGGGPVVVEGINFGGLNIGTTTQTVEAVVTFYDDVDSDATGNTVVTSGPPLATFTFAFGEFGPGGGGTTGFTLPTPVAFPDDDFGISIAFEIFGTDNPSTVVAMLVDAPPTTGTSTAGYWSDHVNPDGQFQGSERILPSAGGNTQANFHLTMIGQIPEPTAAAGLLGTTALLLARRRRTGRSGLVHG